MADEKRTYNRSDLESLAHQIAVRKGVDPTLVKAVIDQETGGTWNPQSVSPAGARGLMQLMPGTAKDLGVKDSFDPVENISGGVEYLKRQINRFGDVGLALAAYNWGPGNAAKLQYNPRSVRVPNETQNYVPGVIGRMAKFGETLMPTATTAALFPKVADTIMGAMRGKVGQRVGEVPAGDIERELKNLTGRAPVPTAGPSMSPTGEPPPPMPMPVMAEGTGGGGAATPAPGPAPEAEQNPLALLTGEAARRTQTQNVDQFLRARFGPLADVADPFPKTYDAELGRLIDRA